MKKMILMAAMFVASVAAMAQNAVGSFSVTPKIGLNVADLTDFENTDMRLGVAVGAELQYQASDLFAISGGLLYSMQGCKLNDFTTKVDYINVPILANVYVVKGLAVKLGIQPGFNVNSSVSYKSSLSKGDSDVDAKTVDFSIPVGLSYEFNNIVLDARYNWGLTKVFEGSDAKNSVFQFTVGYKFGL